MTRSGRLHWSAVGIGVSGTVVFCLGLWSRFTHDWDSRVPFRPTDGCGHLHGSDHPGPLAGLPAVTVPVSPGLRIVADTEQGSMARIRPFVDGTLVCLTKPQDIALVRRILRDPLESDTLRNEAANLLNRSQDDNLTADLIAVLGHPAEEERFRSFAAQHLGMIWLAEGSPKKSPEHNVLLDCLEDRHVEVRREALLPLARGGDPAAAAYVRGCLADPESAPLHDLCIRLVADIGLRDQLPKVRSYLPSSNEVEYLAALDAVARLRDTESVGACERAARHHNPRIAQAGTRSLLALKGGRDD